MAYIQIDVDLDEFDTEELADELISRVGKYGEKGLSDKEKNKLANDLAPLFKKITKTPEGIPCESLDDQIKLEHLKKVWGKYTSFQIEKLLP